MIEFQWKVTKLEAVDEGDLSNVVIISYFDCIGTEGDYTGMASSDVRLLPPDPSDFVPLDDITAEQATAWTIAALGDRAQVYEQMVEQQIEGMKLPKPQTVTLPWMNG